MSQLIAEFPSHLRRLVVDPHSATGPWPLGGAGGAARGSRPDSRANPWGLPVSDSSLGAATTREGGALASTLEDVILGALQEGAPPAATQPTPAAEPAQPAAQDAPPTGAPPASTAPEQQPQHVAQDPSQAAAAAAAVEPSAPHPSHEPSQLPTPQSTPLGLAATEIMQALEAALAVATGSQQPPAGGAAATGTAAPPAVPDAEMTEAAPGGSSEPMQQGARQARSSSRRRGEHADVVSAHRMRAWHRCRGGRGGQRRRD